MKKDEFKRAYPDHWGDGFKGKWKKIVNKISRRKLKKKDEKELGSWQTG